MSLVNTFENELQLLLFNNTTIALLGDEAGILGSAAAGSLWLALHTAEPGGSPGESPANQSASEASYPGYVRQAVIRASSGSPNGGWTVVGPLASNAAQIQFGEHSGGSPASETVTHFSLGYGDGGSPNTDQVIYVGALTSNLAVSVNINPTFAIGAIQISVD